MSPHLRVARANRQFFQGGWAFLLPPLGLYAFGAALNLSPAALTPWMELLHVGLFLGFCAFVWQTRRSIPWLGWGALFAVFVYCGAYVEYPSDAWEHVRRLFSWQTSTAIRDNPIWDKFSYYWGYTLLHRLPLSARHVGLDFYSAFWQTLLVAQFLGLATRLGLNGVWAKLAALGFVLLFGTNVFGWRYYTLSSTPMAYVAYLRAMTLVLEVLDGHRRPPLLSWLALLGVMASNHRQEVIFALALPPVLWGLHRYARSPNPDRWNRVFWFFTLGSVVAGALSYHLLPSLYIVGTSHPITKFGGLRLWGNGTIFMETLGVHGALGLVMGLFFFRQNPRFFGFVLAPAYALFCPLTAVVMIQLRENAYDTYRLLYAVPPSLALVGGLREIERLTAHRWSRISAGALSFSVIILLSLPSTVPFRGRFWFQFHQPSAAFSLKPVAEVAEWMKLHGAYDPLCKPVTDAATDFGLSAHFGNPDYPNRLNPVRLKKFHYFGKVPIAGVPSSDCGFLFRFPPHRDSWVAARSLHWPMDWARESLLVDPALKHAVLSAQATKANWRVLSLPGDYHWIVPSERFPQRVDTGFEGDTDSPKGKR